MRSTVTPDVTLIVTIFMGRLSDTVFLLSTFIAFVMQPCTYIIMIYALAHAIAIVVLHIIVALMVRT